MGTPSSQGTPAVKTGRSRPTRSFCLRAPSLPTCGLWSCWFWRRLGWQSPATGALFKAARGVVPRGHPAREQTSTAIATPAPPDSTPVMVSLIVTRAPLVRSTPISRPEHALLAKPGSSAQRRGRSRPPPAKSALRESSAQHLRRNRPMPAKTARRESSALNRGRHCPPPAKTALRESSARPRGRRHPLPAKIALRESSAHIRAQIRHLPATIAPLGLSARQAQRFVSSANAESTAILHVPTRSRFARTARLVSSVAVRVAMAAPLRANLAAPSKARNQGGLSVAKRAKNTSKISSFVDFVPA